MQAVKRHHKFQQESVVMAGAGKKWMVGCGIGCGLMLLVLGGVGTCGYLGVKKFKEQAESFDVSPSDLADRFGEPSEFVPNPDGTISPERMEAFLAVRDDMFPGRDELSDILSTLDGDSAWLLKAQAGMKMVPAVIGFIGGSLGVLSDHEMGVGEYEYIYALSYYVLLQKDPADGPSFSMTDDHDSGGGAVRFGIGTDDGGDSDDDVLTGRTKHIRGLINELQVEQLNNQIEAFVATLPAGADPAADPWGAQLLAEQQIMGVETLRFLWEDGLPDQLRASLEPFRDRLDASYDPMTSAIEMGLVDED